MAKRLTDEDKILINELYVQLGTYSQVARATGFAPTTVKKYIIKDYKSTVDESIERKIFKTEDIPMNPDLSMLVESKNFGKLCVLTEEEKEEMQDLWKELVL